MNNQDELLLKAIKLALSNENTKLWMVNGSYYITIMEYRSSNCYNLLDWYENNN